MQLLATIQARLYIYIYNAAAGYHTGTFIYIYIMQLLATIQARLYIYNAAAGHHTGTFILFGQEPSSIKEKEL